MDPGKLEYYEFLDLSDIEENERQQLKQTLYSTSTPDFLQLPWTNHNFVTEEWQKETYENEVPHSVPNGPLDEPSGGGGALAPPHLPSVTMYSQHPPPYTMPPPSTGYQHPQSVFVSNVTANMHGYVPYVQPHYMEPPSGHRGRSRGRGKRSMEPTIETSNPGYSQPFVPIHAYHPAYYTQPVQHPNAQHATGSPLYIAPVYTHVYGAYHPGVNQYYPPPIMEDSTSEPMYQQQISEEDYDSNVVATTVIVNSSNPGYMNNGNNVIPEVHDVNSKPVTVVTSETVKTEPEPAGVQIGVTNNNNKLFVEEEKDTFCGDVNLNSGVIVPKVVTPQLQPQPTTIVEPQPVPVSTPTTPQTSAPFSSPVSNPVPAPVSVSVAPQSAPIVQAARIVPQSVAVVPQSVTVAPQSAPIAPNLPQSVPAVPLSTPPTAPISVPSAPVNNTPEEIIVDNNIKPEENVHIEPEPQEPVPAATPGKSWASLFNKSSSPSAISPQITPQMQPNLETGKSTTGRSSNPFPKSEVEIKKSVQQNQKSASSNLAAYSNDPVSHRMGEFLMKYMLDNRTVSLQPRGLTNRSNYCYINSILQALLACPPFYNLLKALPYQPRKNQNAKSPTPIIDSMVEFANEFTPLSAESRLNRKEKGQRKDNIDVICGIAFEPARIYKILNGIRTDTFIVEGRQEDAEEFFGCLLNGLNDEMLELTKLVDGQIHQNLSNGDIATNGESHEQDGDEWTVMGPKNKGSITRRADFGRTPISDIFRGQLRSRVHRTGDQITDNVQPFFTLQLDIEKTTSVYEALELLVNKDKLEGVTCSRTNQQVEAWQQVTIEELPLVMVLHLKCFNYKLDACSKIIKALEFPIDLKIDSKLLSSKAKYTVKQKQYKLFAVVYHDGKEASKGHYLTDAYHVGYGGWVRYDDATVKSVQENQVLHPNASRVPYLLYYRRCDTIGQQQKRE